MKIAVLVSGGVDSSVALGQLVEQGHDVTAFYLKIWLEDELSYLGDCPWEQDLVYARQVCDRFGVPLQVISMQKAYWDRVVAYTIAEVKAGRTPNPDVLCNQQVKFGAFYDAVGKEYDYIATGHYAQVDHTGEVSLLKRAPDQVKDQTYFLAYLSQEQLSRALFPIGHLQKHEVRDLAATYDLLTQDRKDSQGICFLGKFKFADFLRAHLGDKKGDLVEAETGKKVGTHKGFWYYTVGQRQGIGLSGGPWYVVDKVPEKNEVIISRQYEQIAQHKNGMIVADFNWIAKKPEKTDLQVKFRHGPASYAAQVTIRHNHDVCIMLQEPSSQGIAQGQFAVVYDGDICLGGGKITQAL